LAGGFSLKNRIQLEQFSIYQFQIQYPKGWKVELKSKSTYLKGDAAFIPDFKDRKIEIIMSWRPLKNAIERFNSPSVQAEEALKKIKGAKDVQSINIVQSKSVKKHGHQAHFNHVDFNILDSTIFFKGKEKRITVKSFFSYCTITSRYFVIYEKQINPSNNGTELFSSQILKSFSCHS
jgi:hypothetical protein